MLPARIICATRCGVKKLKYVSSVVMVPTKYESTYQPYTQLLSKLNPEELLCKYADIPELKNAPDRVKMLFTVDYGTPEERKETLIEKLVAEIHENFDDLNEQVCEVVKLTVDMRNMQETWVENKTKHKDLKQQIWDTYHRRKDILNELRDFQFELYVRALDVLEIKHVFEPEHLIRKSEIGNEVSDMRIRAFAESRRLIAQKEERERKLLTLKEKIRNDLITKKF